MPDWVCPERWRRLHHRGRVKGIREMFHLGFIKKLPRLLGVQAAGCKPVADAFIQARTWCPSMASRAPTASIAARPRNWRKAVHGFRESER